MLIVPKVKDIPATGVEYRFRIYNTVGVLYGAPLYWRAGFLITTNPQMPYPEGDITAPMDEFAMQLGQALQASSAVGFTVKVGRRWLFDGGETDYDNVGQIPAPPPSES